MGKEVLHDITVTWVCEACGGKAVKNCSDSYYKEPEIPEGWTNIVTIHPKQSVEFTTMIEEHGRPGQTPDRSSMYVIKSNNPFNKLLICPDCWIKLKSGEIWKRELPKTQEKPKGFWSRFF